MSAMKTGVEGIELIKEYEKLRLKAYRCPAGVWTIGYGHTTAAGPPQVRKGDVITPEEAERILKWDMAAVEKEVEKLIPAPLAQNQFDALASFTFNLGGPALARSTLRRRILEGADGEAIAREFARWNKCGGEVLGGLTRRRSAEAALWKGEDWTVFNL